VTTNIHRYGQFHSLLQASFITTSVWPSANDVGHIINATSHQTRLLLG